MLTIAWHAAIWRDIWCHFFHADDTDDDNDGQPDDEDYDDDGDGIPDSEDEDHSDFDDENDEL